MATTENKRNSSRQVVSMEAVLSANYIIERCVVLNLSLGGALIAAHKKLPLGERVRLTFWLPTTKETIDTFATVRWYDENTTGVQFDGLRARQTWALGKYLSELQPSST